MADFTTTGLLASIRRRGMLPSASSTGTADADLLATANEEMASWLVPLVMSLREEYFVQRYSVATTAGAGEYRLPSRAMGGKLREVEIVDAAGRVRNLERISLDELEDWPSGTGVPQGFYLRGGHIALVPTPSGAETLRLTYYQRPGELTSNTSDYVTITGINPGTNTITVSSASGFTTSTLCDLVAGTSGFECLALDVLPTGIASSNVTFASLPSSLAVGDYLCRAQKSPLPQVPQDFHPLLAQRVAAKTLEALGDDAGMKRAFVVLEEMAEALRQTYAPRVDGEPKIVAPTGGGLMGGSHGRDWW